ncbi:extracellular catalytic domain type 1 short-chain-length polyhydroxyalkanoate depolymerase [Nocardia arthritidis]|uniref:extracellular catalytic domain type 1 short-chain-length polyhydroxyalkanoate depolymerase n=1 Tax=Nocardia arthritidis TaxID=228602 RepID=UPI00142DCCEF|nr:PHB depolymerase family esterase [Nocardia arthritidis]
MRINPGRVLAVVAALVTITVWAPTADARVDKRCFTNAAGTRCYHLYLPPGDTAGKPLMVYLHGCDDPLSAPEPSGFSLTRVADEMGFVLAYPLQDNAVAENGCWGWDKPENTRRDQGEPAIIAGITTALADELRLDRTRIYLGGYSAGGAMTTNMGALYPDLYAAIAPMAGAPFLKQGGGQVVVDAMGERARPVPAYFLQTLFDEMSNYVIGRVNIEQWLAADNLADPGSAPTQPTGTETRPLAPGSPQPLQIEHYDSRKGCAIAEFTTPILAEHVYGARLVQDEIGIEIQRDLMRFLLAHRMTEPHRAC